MKCECRPGLVWKKDKCIVKIGAYCTIPSESWRPSFFDPFNKTELDFYSKMEILKPQCPQNCTNELKYYRREICANDAIREIDKSSENHFKDLPRLKFGKSCSLKYHSELFDTGANYTIRLKNLKNIMQKKVQFCDHSRFLTCGTTTSKCECIKPAIYDKSTKNCTFRSPHDPCRKWDMYNYLTDKLPAIEDELMAEFRRLRAQKCSTSCGSKDRSILHCILCPGYLIGKNCDTALTRFMEGWQPPSLPIDIQDYDEQYQMFMEFNSNARDFETLFRLEKGSSCDLMGERDAYRSIRKIKTLELTDTIMTERDYMVLTSSINQTYRHFQKKGLCRYRLHKQGEGYGMYGPKNRPILSCGGGDISNPICYEPTSDSYFQDLMNRVYGNSSQCYSLKAGEPCTPDVRQIIQLQPGFPNIDILLREMEGYLDYGDAYNYLFDVLEDQWVKSTQFCNRTGGFTCELLDYKTNTTGKCTFSEELLAEVLEEARRNSSENSMVTSLLPTINLRVLIALLLLLK